MANEALFTVAFVQITFGMTDGWWLFSQMQDPERVGQDSPLLSWPQWQCILADCGFEHSHCMQGASFLKGQAVIVARKRASTRGQALAPSAEDTHLFSGGLGGLGLLTARIMIQQGVGRLILTSRSDRVVQGSESDWDWLAKHGGDVRRMRCDVSDEAMVRTTIRTIRGSKLQLRGIFHAAHMLADAMIINQAASNFQAAYGPKVQGAISLHAAAWSVQLDYFNVYSSVAGLMGSPGQAPHSAAQVLRAGARAGACSVDAVRRQRHARGFGRDATARLHEHLRTNGCAQPLAASMVL